MRIAPITPLLAAALIVAGIVGIKSVVPVAAQAPGCSVNPNELVVDAEERAALELINSLRADNRIPALSLSSALGQAAAHKSSTMAATGAFSHDDPGRSYAQRIRDCGYRASPIVSENIAAGMDSGRVVVQMWRDSPPHLRNMLDPSMRAVGIARVRGAAGWYWTADFGAATDDGAAPSGTVPATIPIPTTPVTPVPAPGPVPAPSSIPAAAPTPATNPAPPPTPVSLPASAAAPIPVFSPTFQPGMPVVVSTGDGDCLNVRSGPGRGATIVACLADGTTARVADGPISADGVTWWLLDSLGWAAGEYLAAQ
jgi:hypothetical protein